MLSSAKPRLFLAAAGLALAAAHAFAAGTDTDVLTVRVTVQEACTIAGGTLDFGTYNSGQQTALDAQGTIGYNNCAKGMLTIALDGGTANNVASRQMKNGGASLNYQLYTNSGRSQVWGNADGDTVKQTLLEPSSGIIAVFGRIAGGQNVVGGTYTDTVTVTLTF